MTTATRLLDMAYAAIVGVLVMTHQDGIAAGVFTLVILQRLPRQ
jgi:hypothetical protein